MATGNPLDDDAVGTVAHGGPSSDSAPLSTDVSMAQQHQQQQADATKQQFLSRPWTSLYNQANPPPAPPSQRPITDVAKDVGGSVARGSTSAADILLNPSEMVMKPLRTIGTAAYDWLAPKLGGSALTPEQRNDILGSTPQDQGPVSTAVASIPGANPFNTPPTTPVGKSLDVPIQSAIGGAALGPGGLLRRTALGALGGAAGDVTANQVDPRYAPLVGMVTNAIVQGGGQAILPRPGANIDPAVASIAQTGRQEGVPFTAPDITPGSPYRTPASVQATSDALQGNMIRDLGFNPDTGNAVTRNRVTPDLITKGKTNAGNDMSAITSNNNIGPMQNYTLLQQLQNADRQIDTAVDATPEQKTQMRARLAEVRNAVDLQTGVLKGTDYQDLTQTNSPLDNWTGSDNSTVAKIGRGVMTNLDQAFRASLSPDDNAAYTNARYRYRLGSTLEPLADQQQGRSLPMGDLANQLYTQQQRYGSIPGSQLDRYMSQAQLIAGGPTPQGGSPFAPLTQPTAITGMAISPHPLLAALAQLAPGALHEVIGPYARSSARTEALIDAAMNPTTRLQRALATLAPSSVP